MNCIHVYEAKGTKKSLMHLRGFARPALSLFIVLYIPDNFNTPLGNTLAPSSFRGTAGTVNNLERQRLRH